MLQSQRIEYTLGINMLLSCGAFYVTYTLIPGLSQMFIKKQLFGIDMSKQSKVKIPEAQGVVCGAVFLITIFLFIPFAFFEPLTQLDTAKIPIQEFLAALLSICCMIFLGFADDVLDLPWRAKLLFPTFASLPLLMVYYITYNVTVIAVPLPLQSWLGHSIDIGIFYYFYMGMLAVFCTNAINIMAGINGIEAGQSLIIAASVIIFNLFELSGDNSEVHLISLYFIIPFVIICLALLLHNWYPARVFVGDTFCYFAGMTFAVVAILGHFSKTLLLFFIPQVLNFVLSVPQLFQFVPCPRHRLPRYNATTDKLHMSTTRIKQRDLGALGRLIVWLLHFLGLAWVSYEVGEDGTEIEIMNLTIINLAIKFLGPVNEGQLTKVLLIFQVMCSCLALIVRYPLARLFYDK